MQQKGVSVARTCRPESKALSDITKANLLTFEHHDQKQCDSYRLFIHEYVEGAAKRHEKQEEQNPNLQKNHWHENNNNNNNNNKRHEKQEEQNPNLQKNQWHENNNNNNNSNNNNNNHFIYVSSVFSRAQRLY